MEDQNIVKRVSEKSRNFKKPKIPKIRISGKLGLLIVILAVIVVLYNSFLVYQHIWHRV